MNRTPLGRPAQSLCNLDRVGWTFARSSTGELPESGTGPATRGDRPEIVVIQVTQLGERAESAIIVVRSANCFVGAEPACGLQSAGNSYPSGGSQKPTVSLLR